MLKKKMFKVNKDVLKGLSMGVLISTLFLTTSVYAKGRLENINVVKGGITLYVDGKLVKPTDGNGNIVEPMIYDGTTYLPLRSLSNALTNNTKEVKWDAGTSTIYVGEVPVAKQTDLSELERLSGNLSIYTGKDAQFKVVDKVYSPYNCLRSSGSAYYRLDSKYKELNGKFAVAANNFGSIQNKYGSGLYIYGVNKTGDEILIKEYKLSAGEDFIDVKVDLRGVEILKIKTVDRSHDSNAAFHDVNLMGM